MKCIVYRHRRLDTNEIFYIGIASGKQAAYRPYSTHCRNRFWKFVTSKTDYKVEIIATPSTKKDACELEELLIGEYGRRDLGTGCLVNMTDGGEGIKSIKRTKETIEKIRIANTGFKHSEETKLKMSLQAMDREPRFPRKKVSCSNGKQYVSITEASNKTGCPTSLVSRIANGKRNVWKSLNFNFVR